ncbi:MAG TPA: DNA-directed RNA polymerase subunit beta', partial [Actinopolymorphaceae bacterium]
MLDVNFFDELRIGLATGEDIRQWSHGEVKKPETINYRTLKPEKDGLFCEKIFGPTRDWECYCGKYKRVRFKGIICERCGVEVTRAKVRRERMGHIELAAPVTHIWYFKGVPSRLGYLLDLAPKDLEKVIYFAAYMITHVDEEARARDLPSLEAKIDVERKQLEQRRDNEVEQRMKKLEEDLAQLEAEGAKADARRKVKDAAEREIRQIRDRAQRELDRLEEVWNRFKTLKVQDLEGDEVLYREMRNRFGKYFDGDMGAAAIKKRLENFDLEAEAAALRETIRNGKGQKKTRALKRLKVVSAFLTTNNSPLGMVLDCVPVIPPDLRPMVQLDGGRFATSDLNDLYRRVINRNNRLKRLLDLGAPEIIVNNEKRMLQEAVDALFDNGRRGRAVTGPGNRPLKSLSDMLKGKQGRFRQNLLGKRVDYSGRSVIVAGPNLKLHQCGLPKLMALELFKPFIMARLVERKSVQNIKAAKKMVDSMVPEVWDVLEEVIQEHPVLLNRAPTLHRLGIHAIEPVLVEGKAIQVHPLVCHAFNADFDGDQMAVHLPLSAEAQAEARLLMLSANNILSPAHGAPLATPSQDMVLGIYYLTYGPDEEKLAELSEIEKSGKWDEKKLGKRPHVFRSAQEAELSYEHKKVTLHDLAEYRRPDGHVLTTVGRIIFNDRVERALRETLEDEFDPKAYEFINKPLKKKDMNAVIEGLVEKHGPYATALVLDAFKDLGFQFATLAGITISKNDVVIPPEKGDILDRYEKEVAEIEDQYDMGLISAEERKDAVIEKWNAATDEVGEAMQRNLDDLNPIYMMANSGARGSFKQIRQLAGMRGLMANPKGDIIERPIKANFMEGLSVLEYFISTHGARKGLADTALRTADSGYLTRRLVDVAQDVIVRAEDCGTDEYIDMPIYRDGEPNPNIIGRFAAQDIKGKRGRKIVDKGELITKAHAEDIWESLGDDPDVTVPVRSVLKCKADGVCQHCYGVAPATGKVVAIGDAVGIIAAQSIGEPGTQLTMRTFHTGGVAGADITHG